MIRIESANYDNLLAPNPEYTKFQSLRYTIAASADYLGCSALATAWQYTLLVSASASALGGGVSAGGVNSLRVSFAKPTAIVFVTNEAVTATGWFTNMRTLSQENPTMYLMQVNFTRMP